jgi:hypothetical protein
MAEGKRVRTDPNTWTPIKEAAAHLLFADRLSDEEIGRQIGVSRNTILRWKYLPLMEKRFEELWVVWRENQAREMALREEARKRR